MKNLYLIVLLLLTSLPLQGQLRPEIDIEEIDLYFAEMKNQWDVPGLSIGIVKDGKLVFSGNYGTIKEGENQKPDNHTLYAIASNSKAFTSMIIGMLVQEGKLSWDDKVRKHVPYFDVYDPWVSEEATVRDLLCHRIGLGTFSGDIIWYKSDLSSEEIIKGAKFLPKAFDFRSGFGYSNIMYITAGEVIRAVTGKSWSENLKERILKPLGMDRTITSPDELEDKGNYATPHGRQNHENTPILWEDWEEIGALGGIISSVDDISKWITFNLDHGIWKGDTLIGKATWNILWTPHNNFLVDHTSPNDFDRHFRGYGLGWGLSDYHGNLLVQHTGGYDGMKTAVSLIPDKKLGVVVLTNGMKSPIMAATYYALEKFLGHESRDWSTYLLERFHANEKRDTRITDIRAKRITNTKPSLPLKDYEGVYRSDIYGKITIVLERDQLKLRFEHSPRLSANLKHWHYDVWEIDWDEEHAWFDFGTVKFNTDNNMKITGMEFQVPNDDIFFEELKPYRIKDLGGD